MAWTIRQCAISVDRPLCGDGQVTSPIMSPESGDGGAASSTAAAHGAAVLGAAVLSADGTFLLAPGFAQQHGEPNMHQLFHPPVITYRKPCATPYAAQLGTRGDRRAGVA